MSGQSVLRKENIPPVEAETVAFRDDCVVVYLSDGRTISTPVAWYDELFNKPDEDLRKCEVTGRGAFLLWPTLDVIIPTKWIIDGVSG